MNPILTMPGKLGDALLQWPVARRYAIENETKVNLWLDEKTCGPLVNLFSCQPEVSSVSLRGGIENYSMGGQPWDFGLTTADHLDAPIFHLGMRQFPSRQITLQCANDVPFRLRDIQALSQEPSLTVPKGGDGRRRVILHGSFMTHTQSVPTFWRFLSDIWDDLRLDFEVQTFVGPTKDLKRAQEIYPDAEIFDDHGDLLASASLMAGAALVIGCGSSMVALAGQLKVPSIRVHDPIGDHPRVIWSNLGPQQWNEIERDLRKQWPAIRARITQGDAVPA